jgi:hypothetical protein
VDDGAALTRMPENEDGELPIDIDHDNPDEWRDVADDDPTWPNEEDDDG